MLLVLLQVIFEELEHGVNCFFGIWRTLDYCSYSNNHQSLNTFHNAKFILHVVLFYHL
jgi:hypothetical protein